MIALVALIVIGTALVFDTVGLAIPYWEKVEGADVHAGLWLSCGGSICNDIQAPSDALKAVRAMVLIGMILLIGAVLCACLKLVAMKEHQRLPKLAGFLAIIAGVHILIGCIVYATDVRTDDIPGIIEVNLHAGFALCIIAGVAAIVGGILFIVHAAKE